MTSNPSCLSYISLDLRLSHDVSVNMR